MGASGVARRACRLGEYVGQCAVPNPGACAPASFPDKQERNRKAPCRQGVKMVANGCGSPPVPGSFHSRFAVPFGLIRTDLATPRITHFHRLFRRWPKSCRNPAALTVCSDHNPHPGFIPVSSAITACSAAGRCPHSIRISSPFTACSGQNRDQEKDWKFTVVHRLFRAAGGMPDSCQFRTSLPPDLVGSSRIRITFESAACSAAGIVRRSGSV